MELNELAVEFLEVTIPYYAADPKWKVLFEDLVNLSEEERTGMLRKLNTINGPQLLGLENNEQFPSALEFIRRSLEEPLNLQMMIKLIDYENLRIHKKDEVGIA